MTLDQAYTRTIEAITKGMAEAFDEIWSRPDGPALATAFLAGEVFFHVTRHGVTILAEHPADGATVPDTPRGLD